MRLLALKVHTTLKPGKLRNRRSRDKSCSDRLRNGLGNGLLVIWSVRIQIDPQLETSPSAQKIHERIQQPRSDRQTKIC